MGDFIARYWKLQYWLHEQDKPENGVWLDDENLGTAWQRIDEKLVAVGPPLPFNVPGLPPYKPWYGESMTYRVATAGWSHLPIEYGEPFTLGYGEVLGMHYGGT